jgi:hypothetical protein
MFYYVNYHSMLHRFVGFEYIFSKSVYDIRKWREFLIGICPHVEINQHKSLTTVKKTVIIWWQIDLYLLSFHVLFTIDTSKGYFYHSRLIKSKFHFTYSSIILIKVLFTFVYLSQLIVNVDVLDDKQRLFYWFVTSNLKAYLYMHAHLIWSKNRYSR